MDSKFNFREGEVLLVDKPLNWTSFQVVNKLRYEIRHKLGIKKIKVGHAGTLDPLATGLLILCTGKKTKTIDSMLQSDKTYTGVIRLGATTPSFDLETEIDKTFDTTRITPEDLETARQKFVGKILQTPPVFSAKKVDGKRAYDSARAGKTVELKPVQVEIHEFETDATNFPDIRFKVRCTKGTYIRSLAHDFGLAANSGAHLISLRRTASGDYNIDDAHSIEEWIELIRS